MIKSSIKSFSFVFLTLLFSNGLSAEVVNFSITMGDGRQFSVKIDDSATIEGLKVEIKKQAGIDVSKQKIEFKSVPKTSNLGISTLYNFMDETAKKISDVVNDGVKNNSLSNAAEINLYAIVIDVSKANGARQISVMLPQGKETVSVWYGVGETLSDFKFRLLQVLTYDMENDGKKLAESLKDHLNGPLYVAGLDEDNFGTKSENDAIPDGVVTVSFVAPTAEEIANVSDARNAFQTLYQKYDSQVSAESYNTLIKLGSDDLAQNLCQLISARADLTEIPSEKLSRDLKLKYDGFKKKFDAFLNQTGEFLKNNETTRKCLQKTDKFSENAMKGILGNTHQGTNFGSQVQSLKMIRTLVYQNDPLSSGLISDIEKAAQNVLSSGGKIEEIQFAFQGKGLSDSQNDPQTTSSKTPWDLKAPAIATALVASIVGGLYYFRNSETIKKVRYKLFGLTSNLLAQEVKELQGFKAKTRDVESYQKHETMVLSKYSPEDQAKIKKAIMESEQ